MNKPNFTQSLFILIWLLFSTNLSAQNTVNGKITDARSGEPLIGANIIINKTSVGVTSDDTGHFSLSQDKDFPWTINITYTGYNTQTIEVKSNTQDLVISLESGLTIGQEIVVSASRKAEKITDSPASVSVLTSDKIELLAVPAGDPINLLKNIQSVTIIQNGINKSNITLRGITKRITTRTLVLKDYRPLNDFYNTNLDNERVPLVPLDIDRVEVVRGPSGALWGPGVSSGVIHFISKDPFRHPGLSAEVSYGNSFGDDTKGQAADVTKIDLRYAGSFNNKIGWKILGSYRTGNDFIFDLTSEENWGNTLTAGEYAASEVSSVGAPSSRDGQWTDFAGNTIDMEGIGIGISRTDGGGPFNMISRFSSFNIEGTLEYKVNDEVSFAVVPSYGQSEGNFGNSGIFYYENLAQFNTQVRANIGKLFASANYRTTPTFNGDTKAGPGWVTQYNTTSFRDTGGSNYMDFQAQLPIEISDKSDLVAGVDVKTMVRKYEDTYVDGSVNTLKQLGVFSDERYTVMGAYAQYTQNLTEQLKVIAAARVDNWNVYGTAFSPKLGLVYNQTPTSSWRIAYNQANTASNMALTYFQSNVAFRRINNRNVFRAFYGTGQPITFNNPLTGLSIGTGLNLKNQFDGIDVPLATILSIVAPELDVSVNGTSAGSLFSMENPAGSVPIDNVNVLDNPKRELETIQSFELGYKGLIKNKLSIGIDFYYNIEDNVPTPAIMISPAVAYPNAASDLGAALTEFVSSGAITQVEADAAIATAEETFGSKIVGVVVSDQHQDLDITNVATYGFRAYNGAKYFGIDFGGEYYLNNKNSLFLNWAWVNDNVFSSEELGEDPDLNRVFHLNAPKNRIRLGYNFNSGVQKGFFGNISILYNSEFEANYGDFRGIMSAVTSVDAAIGYDLNNGVKISISSTNLLDADIYGLPYLPKQGRMVVGTVRYNLRK